MALPRNEGDVEGKGGQGGTGGGGRQAIPDLIGSTQKEIGRLRSPGVRYRERGWQGCGHWRYLGERMALSSVLSHGTAYNVQLNRIVWESGTWFLERIDSLIPRHRKAISSFKNTWYRLLKPLELLDS